jgi:N-acetylmuramoyl-L-alanine amidase CwlA
MAYPIKQDIIPDLPRKAYRNGVYEGVVDHSTATPEATDEAESRYFHREWKNRQAFPHFVVDWDSITQLADTDYIAWAAGNGNPRYVHIELCETKDHAKFLESYKRYVWLTAYLLRKKNLGVTDGKTLVSHDWVSKNLGGTNHTDPIAYLKSHGVSWAQHVANIKAEYDSYFKKEPVKKEETDMLEKAIVIGGFPDMSFAEVLAARLKAPIYTRAALPSSKVAKELYVVGGATTGLQADKVISLTGADRFAVAAAVKKFLG